MGRCFVVCFILVNVICIFGILFFTGTCIPTSFTYTSDKLAPIHNIFFQFNKLFFKTTQYPNSLPKILLPSANLWRPGNTSIPIQSDRLIAQYLWIKYLSDTIGDDVDIKKKKILLFDAKTMSLKDAEKISCPGYELKLCTITKSEDLLHPYEVIENFDAAVFTYVHRYNISNLILPRNVKQVIHAQETPFRLQLNFSLNNAIYASYFSLSDIVIPYGKWIPYLNYPEPPIQFQSIKTKIDKNRNYANGKTGMAIIFTSNCKKVKNNRMGYVEELKKYVQVDVYGACGTLKTNCSKTENKEDGCMQKIIQRYKFYLAFENANCRDYITEKVYHNAIRNDVVPVVLGAHPDDYRREFPLYSYIHVEDFQSPQRLGEYLNFLNTNDALYNEYFEWKGSGEFHPAINYYLCRICGMLFYSDYVSHPVWNPKNSSWQSVDKCLDENQWYWHPKNNEL